MTTTIFHNPDCGTSRNVLALLRAAGEAPEVIEYLRTPPTRDALLGLLARMGLRPRDLLREKDTPFAALGLGDPGRSEAELVEAMLGHPLLINRPVVVTARGAKLCRPSELVLDLLAQPPAGALLKEDGTPFLADRRIAADDPALHAALREAGLPTADLEAPGRCFFAYRDLDGAPLGMGGYEALGELALIRSVVVPAAARGRGVGSGLVALLLRRAFDAGARQAWLLTTAAAPFFEGLGFRPVPRAAAPAAVLATQEASRLCPASAVLMTRAIRP